jgi:hypothetical protein
MDTKEGRRRRRRGGKRRTQAKERKLSIKDAGLKELLGVMARLLAKTAATTRQMWSILVCTVIVPEDCLAVMAMKREGKAFAANAASLRAKVHDAAEGSATAEARKALQGVGPPAPSQMVALCEGLLQMDVGRAAKQRLQEQLVAWAQAPPTMVDICRLETAYAKGRIKVIWACTRDDSLSQLLKQAFLAFGEGSEEVHVPTGAAPSGWLEDELSAWIDQALTE